MALALRAGLGTSQHPLIAALQNGLQTLFQSPSSILELFPPIILAVPKSKVSHSRKRMRAANKHLQEKHNIVTCGGCGRAKQSHHLCPYCYSQLSRGFKSEAKQLAKHSSENTPQQASTSSTSFFNDPDRSPAESEWAKARGGAKPVQQGQVLTKWMRARLGYTKMDTAKVLLGQEERNPPRKPRRGMWQQENDNEKDQDNDNNDDDSTGLPPNLRFA